MDKVFIILGIVVFIFAGLFTLGIHIILKCKTGINQLMKDLEDKHNVCLPEEQVIALLKKMFNFSSVITIIGVLMIALGIAL